MGNVLKSRGVSSFIPSSALDAMAMGDGGIGLSQAPYPHGVRMADRPKKSTHGVTPRSRWNTRT